MIFKKIYFNRIAILIFSVFISAQKNQWNTKNAWQHAKRIEDKIGKFKFPNNQYNILDFGASTQVDKDNTTAINNAIKFCSSNGGGYVVVPAGKYKCAAIHLDNNVNLHLEKGSEILFSTNPNDYQLVHTSFEGIELMNYSPLIYAYSKTNIAVSGSGILNGQADRSNWWPWKGTNTENIDYGYIKGNPSQNDSLNLPRLMKFGEMNIPVKERVFGNGHYLRPNFIEPFNCTNVIIEGVTIINAPFWILHPIKCENVLIDNVTIESHGPNNDGCDPEYSKNVVIRNSIFNTGDDCIAIKAGRDSEGRRIGIKSENIIIKNCKMYDGHGGVVIGSEMSAGVVNVFVEDCLMNSSNLDRAIRIKTNSKRGGIVDGLYVRNIKVLKVKEAVLRINMNYNVYGNQIGNHLPIVKNIFIEDIDVIDGGKYALYADGLEKSFIENVLFKNVKIEKVNTPFKIEYLENLKLINTKINNKVIDSL